MDHLQVHLIHWKADEAAERLERLAEAGFAAAHVMPSRDYVKSLAADPPAAVVIDLDRLASHGREVALAIRMRKATRSLPIVFVAGAQDKVERTRAVLPEAVFTAWGQIGEALRDAIAHPPAPPTAKVTPFDAYAGRPLPAKLGITPGAVVGVIAAPPDFADMLGDLPDGAEIRELTDDPCDLTVWFVRTETELRERIGTMAEITHQGPLWIARPKKGASRQPTLTEQTVRRAGLAEGIVDYKICSFGEAWSGILFSRKKVRAKGRAAP